MTSTVSSQLQDGGMIYIMYVDIETLFPLYTGTQRPTNSINVFILYCKDHQLPQTFSDDVLDLADILIHCGGFTCTIDHYVNIPPANWNIWTQQRIEESQYVLLVCSPTLAQALREPANYMLDMEKGKYYVSTVVNFIQPQKVIPVYLNCYIPQADPLGWVPTQLHMSSLYCLNISEFRSVLTVPEGTPRHVLDEKLRTALSEDRFKSITKLVNHLRGEIAISQPVSPENAISGDINKEFPDTLMRQIAIRLKEEWYNLGVKLGVNSFELDDVKEGLSNPTDYESATKKTFWLWRIAKGRLATRAVLKQALVEMKYGRLAEELFHDV